MTLCTNAILPTMNAEEPDLLSRSSPDFRRPRVPLRPDSCGRGYIGGFQPAGHPPINGAYERAADRKSVIQQVGNLRYDVTHIGFVFGEIGFDWVRFGFVLCKENRRFRGGFCS